MSRLNASRELECWVDVSSFVASVFMVLMKELSRLMVGQLLVRADSYGVSILPVNGVYLGSQGNDWNRSLQTGQIGSLSGSAVGTNQEPQRLLMASPSTRASTM